ncbi:MAG TPA: hypothetical protein DDZ57_05875 [Porphyromonadaceae bacterium]|jgi:hypothetical protein|nr:hypothetical protein [Porphyromonadaceae bacterium]
MEENRKPPINEEYIMSIVSETRSGHDKLVLAENEQVRQVSEKKTADNQPQERGNDLQTEKQEIRENKKRKNRQLPIDYESRFIKKADLTVRSGKGVYIRADYHNSINRIISVIGNNEISITDYLDNILTHHFEMFEQEITDVFDRNYKPLIHKNR